MNFVDGPNLDNILFGSDNELPVDVRIDIGIKVVQAINYMHLRKVVHQDIKPQNVLVTADFKGVYICDLGVAKFQINGTLQTSRKGTGPGTAPYMAPEMYGTACRGTAADIYSFGCLLIELFGAKRVWGTLTAMQIMQKVCGTFTSAPQSPSTDHLRLFPERKRICDLCTQLEANDRPNAAEVLKRLKQLIIKHP